MKRNMILFCALAFVDDKRCRIAAAEKGEVRLF